MTQRIDLEQAVDLVPHGCTLGVGGFCGFGAPDSILREMGKRYAKTGSPGNITLVTPASAGDKTEDGWGISFLREDGLIDTLISSIVMLPKAIQRDVEQNKIACFFLPLGVFGHLFRAAAGGEPGVLTHVGLHTFCDPRVEGCKINDRAKESGREVVRIMPVDGRDYLFYPSIKMDVCLLRGTYADADGNISIEKEAVHAETLEMANAVHNNGGVVIFQVQEIVESGSLDPKMVVVHKSAVDYIVLSAPGDHVQNYEAPEYRPELTGEARIPLESIPPMEMGLRKIVARRALMELKKGALINLGLGVSEGIALVANEEGITKDISLSMETGVMGGVPLSGVSVGAGINPDALYKMPDTFDLYNGGGLDQCFLSGAQIDEAGNVNVSKFNGHIVGPGGFINITQNTRKICFSGVFTAGNVRAVCDDGKLSILKDGTALKFVKRVEQITFSGRHAVETGKEVLFITERAVFCLTSQGLELIEIAPGVDLERDILAKMEFVPLISRDLKLMDARIFKPEKMNVTLIERPPH
jgi:propionate CoA-transferase